MITIIFSYYEIKHNWIFKLNIKFLFFREVSKEKECPIIYVECSSHFSAKAAERLGFTCIYTLYFQDYVNENGEVIFKTNPPHNASKVYVLTL